MTGPWEPQPAAIGETERASIGGARVLLSGATGFIGASLLARLVELDCEVVALVRAGGERSRIAHLLDRIELVEADVADLDADDLLASVGRVDITFHLAAAGVVAPDLDPRIVLDVNVGGTLRMLQAARALGCRRFVYSGSCFEYGSGELCGEQSSPAPLTEYGASKAAGWLVAQTFARRHGLPVVGLRPFTVYGPMEAEHRLVPHVIRAALAGRQIELTAGRQRRDFVYVGDVVDGFIAAAVAARAVGEVFNLCSGQAVAVSELASLALGLMGSDQEPLLGARRPRAADSDVLVGDPRKARQLLGFDARTSLSAGLTETLDWHRKEMLVADVAQPVGSGV